MIKPIAKLRGNILITKCFNYFSIKVYAVSHVKTKKADPKSLGLGICLLLIYTRFIFHIWKYQLFHAALPCIHRSDR